MNKKNKSADFTALFPQLSQSYLPQGVRVSGVRMGSHRCVSVIVINVVILAAVTAQDCVWNKDENYPPNPPIILDDSHEIVRPVLEGEDRIVRLAAKSKVTLACPGTKISNLDVAIRVCFDPKAETTLYSENVIHGANIAAKDKDNSRPGFKSSTGFFTVSMSNVYTEKSQLNLMIDLLGDEDLAHKIIDVHKQFYLARGHMAPDADFVTEAEQDATYYYINAVPQWQAFNNGNWKFLEFATRDLAVKHGSDLTVYSGGWDLLELDDINNNSVKIYLGLTEGKEVVPAPAITWKVVYEKSSKRAAAIVGVNNPHLEEPPTKLCPDLCDSLVWVNFDLNDLVHGFTYCCTVDDLRQAVPHVPDLGDVDLLTD
ncbi:Nuclease EXOG-like 1 [Homarus americanus]|uniref:Nuclease EXOG-like 1 n=1 Tax=Homarus americanus TaxID=6706 RepID=A0A8J5NAX0_HOMAM|nr:Nuclease EXOG-like 1 [Homarus americanus]